VIHPLHDLPRQGDDPVTPFARRTTGLRPLRLIVDTQGITDRESLAVLESLCDSPDVDAWGTSDDLEQWWEIDFATVQNDHFPVIGHRPGGTTYRGLLASTWRRISEKAETDLPFELVLRELGYTEVAHECRFDLLVTDSEFLLSGPFKTAERLNIRSTKDAVALVALLLRSRGICTLGDSEAFVQGSFWFYLVAARATLPASASWFRACVLSSGDRGGLELDAEKPSLAFLAQMTYERIDWAIRTRDTLLTTDELQPYYLDTFLFQIIGAFDTVAQVAHLALGLSSEDGGNPSWRTKRWLRELAKHSPDLAAVVAEKTAHGDALEIIGLLRNTIHEGGLPTIDMNIGFSSRSLTTVRTPRGGYAARSFKESIERLGGPGAWGIHEITTGVTTLAPKEFVDRALVASLGALNALMHATPTEMFPKPESPEPPASVQREGPDWPWSTWTYDRTLLVLGLIDDVRQMDGSTPLP
jgi:hypothetical protein